MRKNRITLERYKEIKKQLRRLYPDIFLTYKPLKIGIREDIIKDNKLVDVSLEELKIVINCYCTCKKYLEIRQVGAARYDLNGNEIGVVEEYIPIVKEKNIRERVTRTDNRAEKKPRKNNERSGHNCSNSNRAVATTIERKITNGHRLVPTNKPARPMLSLKK